MAENEDEAPESEETEGPESTAPAGPFLRDFNPLTDGYPRVSPRSAVVQFYRNGGYTVKRASGVQHVDKPVLARPHSICEIALGTYVTPLQMELPAAGGTTFFKAEVDIEWAVTDPHLAALAVVTDVANRLTSPVLERLREVTTTYRVTEAEQANRAITRECAGGRWADLGSELGLRVRLYVRLRVDDRTIEHADEERDAHAQAKVIRLRQESYRRMLQGGELEQLSFMLAADPEGAKDFLEKIRQEGRQDEKDRVARLFAMAQRGELATVDVETQVLNLLNQGDGRPVVGPIGTVPARRPRELEASAGDRPFNPDWASDEPPRRRPNRPAPRRSGPDGYGSDGYGGDRYGGDRYGSDRRGPGRGGPDRGEPYDPRDDAEFDEPRAGARGRPYRAEPYAPYGNHDDEPRSRDGRQGRRPGPSADRDDDPRIGDRPRNHRPGAYAGHDDEPRSRDRRPAHRPEPYHPDDEVEVRRLPRRPELGSGGPVPGDEPEDGPRSGERPRTYRPEPYYPDDEREWERSRRRRRAEDDGWSWAEEDR
ncbi:hypothetical protein [Streptomyces chartreusis]|jgi:hypothetical protein|uniref:hypothetical protein n=1 Tax=Streptomyces chartreusis TaxID=1969 RepID=UPI0037FA156C|nr:hypothetical protein OG938_17150 [Streptomyces chartreusis]WTA29665.1 hypothetical protein OIA45_28220 [Streptomyces chartreusis]